MYKVIVSFIDGRENKHYNVGDAFIVGPLTDKERIDELTGYNNSLQQPLIQEVDSKQKTKGE